MAFADLAQPPVRSLIRLASLPASAINAPVRASACRCSGLSRARNRAQARPPLYAQRLSSNLLGWDLVPGAGLEPARRVRARDFKSLVSTDSTTRAGEASATTRALDEIGFAIVATRCLHSARATSAFRGECTGSRCRRS